MTGQLTVLGLGGSTSTPSWSEILLRKALIAARNTGLRPILFPLGRKELPLLRADLLTDPPPLVAELLAAARAADALILSTPVYHGTVSGAVKNALDLLQALAGDDPPWLAGRAVGLMAVGSAPGSGAHAITALDHACRALRATTVPTAVLASGPFLAADGSFTDEQLPARLARMAGELRSHARLGHAAPVREAVTRP